MTATLHIPVIPEATLIGPLPAQLRRPRARAATPQNVGCGRPRRKDAVRVDSEKRHDLGEIRDLALSALHPVFET
jgi:hypothetical protein